MDFRDCPILPGYRDRVRSSSPRHILADLHSFYRVIELQTHLEFGSYPRIHLRFARYHAVNVYVHGISRPQGCRFINIPTVESLKELRDDGFYRRIARLLSASWHRYEQRHDKRT